MKSGSIDRRAPIEHALVIEPVHPRQGGVRSPAARLDEAVDLALAVGLEVRQRLVAPLRAISPASLFGQGKVDEIVALCKTEAIDVVVVDDALTPIQQRNLERAWQVKVVDRTGLILEIFSRRARTREGRLQVELARLNYERSRLVRTWTHLERQRGGFGFLGGPGETQIEADRRLLLERILRLKAALADVRRTRGLQRRARRRAPYPTIALVGYTNAGKSTLFNRLTHADVLAKDMVFATLDPTMRRLGLPDGRPAVLSDTVGFITDLPHELVDAFRATLEEVREADLIVHVRDIARPDTSVQCADVARVLAAIGVNADSSACVLEVWNKADLLDQAAREEIVERARRVGAVIVSAMDGEGVASLREVIARLINQSPEVAIHLEPGDGEALAWLYRHARVTAREETSGAVFLNARLDPQAFGRFARMRPGALGSSNPSVSGVVNNAGRRSLVRSGF